MGTPADCIQHREKLSMQYSARLTQPSIDREPTSGSPPTAANALPNSDRDYVEFECECRD